MVKRFLAYNRSMNKLGFITHPVFLKHEMGAAHPECPERISSILNHLKKQLFFPSLIQHDAPLCKDEVLRLGHTKDYIQYLTAHSPLKKGEYFQVDEDSIMNKYTLEAAYRAVGAINLSVDLIMKGQLDRSFCLVRPPGHHAEPSESMGFCFFNNVALGALYLKKKYGLKRILIFDFDVHHGNGTESIVADHPEILFISTFQHPFYPQREFRKNNPHIINIPLPAGIKSKDFQKIVSSQVLNKIEEFQPEFIFISAGFDGHRLDPLGGFDLGSEDFCWLTKTLGEYSSRFANNRIISSLEGGYNLKALTDCVTDHIKTLLET